MSRDPRNSVDLYCSIAAVSCLSVS